MNIEIKPDYAMDSAIDQGERRVVIDNGSDTIKVGFSGEDWPQVWIILNISEP
jgi:actin-related protein